MSMMSEMSAGYLLSSGSVRASGVYLCLPCDRQFDYAPGHTDCPICHAEQREDVAALYIEHDAEVAEFIHAFDFGEGD